MALVYQSSYKAAMLLLVGLLFLQASGPALGSNGKTCYSRQHRDAIVDVRVAVERNGAITSSRVKQAEKDCILACCSEEVEPGVKCNMVVYKPSSQAGMDNCYLFHCETEQDCPLVAAKPGTNTYDISKDVIHPTAKGNGRTTVMPIIRATPVKQPVATQTTSTAMRPTTTTTTPRIMQPSTTTTTTQPTTTTSTTQTTTTTTTTTLPTTTTTQATTTSTTTTTKHPPTELAIVLVTMPVVTMPSSPPPTTTPTTTTTTTTTQLTSTTTKVPSTTSPTTTTTTTRPPQPPKPPQPPGKPNRPPKKPLKPQKRPEPQAGKSSKVPTNKPTTTTTTTTQKPTTTQPTTTPTTTTNTTTTPPTTTTTTTTTTSTTTTTTTTSTATAERTTIVVVEMENGLKDETSGPDTLLPPAVGSGLDKGKGSQMTWRNSLVAIVVVTLICLTLVLAIVGRKAMESFDRRHYTRLELNDLHYEI